MKSSLFYKIAVSYLVIVVLSLLTIGFFISRQIESELTRAIKEELVAQSRPLTLLPHREIKDRISALAEISRSRVTLIDASGGVVADSERKAADMENHLNRPEVQEARLKSQGDAVRYSQTLGVNMLYIALSLRDGAELKGYVRLARPLQDVKKLVDQLYRSVFGGILIITILSLLIALIFFRKFILPIQKVESFTGKVCRSEDPGTLLVESDDEIGRLAGNINRIVLEHDERIKSARMEKGKLESAFASMIEGIVVLDRGNRIESINKGMKDIIAQQYSSDIVGKTPLEAFRNLELQNALYHFNEGRDPVSCEISLGEDNPIVLSVNISAIHGLPGEEKTMMVFHEMTRLKQLEKMREDFVANVTHEIKTPLTAIIGFIETLQEGAMEDRAMAKQFLQTVSDNAHRLNRLVDDLLILSDIELGEMKLRLEGISVGSVIDHILPLLDARIAGKNLTIQENLAPDLPLIQADRDRVVQILLNVLDNAVKFTSDGGQVLIAAFESDGYMVIRVTDTGIGIPKSDLPRIGERFYRVDKTRSRELGGTGLGLSIVKHLMKAHQGKVQIESNLGRGTTISLYFPIYKGQNT